MSKWKLTDGGYDGTFFYKDGEFECPDDKLLKEVMGILNSHDALVEALEASMEQLRYIRSEHMTDKALSYTSPSYHMTVGKYYAALKLAKGSE